MNYYDSFQLNIYTLVLLAILLISMFVKKEIYKTSARILRFLIFILISLLVLEMLSWTFDGIDTKFAYIMNYTFNLLFFLTGVFAAGIFASYVDYMNFKSRTRLKKRFYYLHMFVFAVILGIINFFTPIIFTLSSTNVYSREPYIVLGFGSVYLLLIFMLFQTFRNRKKLEKGEAFSIFMLILLPFIGGVLQMFIFGLLIMWALAGLGAMVAYIFNETISNSKDYLTKLYTREITYAYMDTMINNDQGFTLISIDIDSFKEINDSFGHKMGDEVLIHFSKILLTTFEQDSLVSRFGGDEFVVVLKNGTPKEVEAYRKKLESNLTLYKELEIMKDIKFSYGSAGRISGSTIDIDNLLDASDKMMYVQKSSHKNLRRRASDK